MEQARDVILQAALQVILPTAVSIVLALAGTYLIKLIQQARLKLGKEQLELLNVLAAQFVRAAEQYDMAGILKMVGAEKKAWVLGRLDQELTSHNVRLDVEMLSDAIESAVLKELKQIQIEFEAEAPGNDVP